MENFNMKVLTEDGAKFVTILQEFAEKHDLRDYEEMKKFLYPRFVRKSMIQSRDDIVKTEYLDFYIIYAVVIEMTADKMHSATVTKDIARDWGVNANQLFYDSIKYGQERFPEHITPIEDILGLEPEEANTFYVCSNEYKIAGASVILFDKVLKGFRDRFGESFYVLPSSVHEMLFIPDSLNISVNDLRTMVSDVNATVVAGQNPDDILSNNVYRFDKDGLWIVR